MQFAQPLPIDAVLEPLSRALDERTSAVLVAPPGAGKTTRVPLMLLEAPWRAGRKILVLEPRRLAARGAAERMAKTLGQSTGETVGFRARLGSRVGPQTAIEVVTEGIFTRMILDDPTLDGVAAVLFDEFHERSLDADLGLALALDTQAGLRDNLRVLVMSATLDGARVAATLGQAPVIESEGRAFSVETRYVGRDTRRRIEDQMCDAIATALRAETGSVLAFFPGQGEIRRTAERLAERITDKSIVIAPLFGAMDAGAQDRAVAPTRPGERKVVLATSIAETSLTIEGVRVVVDCGLARVPRFDADAGVTRLDTVRVSRAAADQRRGRAGRTEPGVCYRLWDEPETQSLPAFADPEIRNADLTGLLLDCASWGVTDPATMRWLDAPPPAALAAARETLTSLEAIGPDGRITALGTRIRALPLPPHLARMVLLAADRGAARDAAELAAVIVERGLGGNDTDLDARLQSFRRDRGERASQMRRLAEGWARDAKANASNVRTAGSRARDVSTAQLLALADPDRVAKARGAAGHFLLAGGRGAHVDASDPLARAPFLVVADMAGRAAATRILLAARLDEADLATVSDGRISHADDVTFDPVSAKLKARRVRRLGAITLDAAPLSVPADEHSAAALARGLAGLGIDRLPWSKSQSQLRDRVAFLRQAIPELWPDLSDAALATTAGAWLAPFLIGKQGLSDIGADDLGQALDTLLPWDLKRRLDAEAPTHFEAPTGNSHPIRYDGAGAPLLAIRVQELFGLKAHPSIANGRLPLTLELLSPAHRPIQITRDLPGFWAGSWRDVKADMRGRYPRHVWPDDPAAAAPTARAKPRGT
jgi:ATP-dependent helicase HrpB